MRWSSGTPAASKNHCEMSPSIRTETVIRAKSTSALAFSTCISSSFVLALSRSPGAISPLSSPRSSAAWILSTVLPPARSRIILFSHKETAALLESSPALASTTFVFWTDAVILPEMLRRSPHFFLSAYS